MTAAKRHGSMSRAYTRDQRAAAHGEWEGKGGEIREVTFIGPDDGGTSWVRRWRLTPAPDGTVTAERVVG